MSEDVDQLIDWLASVAHDPYRFALEGFPWGEAGTVLEHRRLEDWQVRLLCQIRDGLITPGAAIRTARVSGNGVGKSAIVSILILFLHCTFEDTKGVVTANTETQLKTKTWAELGKWFNLFLAKELFRMTATGLFSRDPDRDRTWRTDMVPWSEHNVVAFQGLHNEGKRLFMIFDEASGIMDGIWEAADGCMTDANTERIFAIFGNPNEPKGRFRECFDGGKFASLWQSEAIDSRSVSFTDKDEFAQWIKAYGEDSDFVRVRIRGVFPRIQASSFIAYEACKDAIARPVPEWNNPMRILGVDVARFGDDASVIVCRAGKDARSIEPEIFYGLDTMQLAAKVSSAFQRLGARAVMVDGGGVGGGVIDRLRQLRIPVYEVDFGSSPDGTNVDDPNTRYYNKRAEIWGAMKAWLEDGCLNEQVAPGYSGTASGAAITTLDELTAPTYTLTGREEIQLESKKDMKRRGVPSPNWADALACTFAFPIYTPPLESALGMKPKPIVADDYNPFELERMNS